MGKIYTLVAGRYVKDKSLCRKSGCRNTPAPNMKYCNDCLAWERKRGVKENESRRLQALEVVGNTKCAVPGCNICDPTMLEIDHVNNDAKADRSHTHYQVWLYKLSQLCKTPEGRQELSQRLQVLCSCHNRQKELFRARKWQWSLEIASARLKEFSAGLVSQPRT